MSGAEAVAYLLSARAVRERSALLLERARADALEHFALEEERLPATADYVLETIRAAYPRLEIPYHSRWRHFTAGGIDRWAPLGARIADPVERGRARVELAVVSVLLDAGTGPAWRYREQRSGQELRRSEALAVASLDWVAGGALSSDPAAPWRVEAGRLRQISAAALAGAFQVTPDNPLDGLEGRVTLLRRLGEVVAARPEIFSEEQRLGRLFDHLARSGPTNAEAILAALLDALGPIWPGRLVLAGRPLGDAWRHPELPASDGLEQIVPFHKLSQWLAYSLIEPLEEVGVAVAGLDALTGLAEYRNGGLLVDLGMLRPKHPRVTAEAHAVGAPVVVEWRALTVALLDAVAATVRDRLGLDAAAFPLARVLEGGTWAAGRRAARERRSDGAPPIRVLSDGTVF